MRSLREGIADRNILRRAAIPVFSRVNPGDISIRHQWTGRSIRVHSFRHKGYWYHGKSRERAEMLMFARILGLGQTVIEVGAHIGYVSQWFAEVVGPGGTLVCLEPGDENRGYLETNLQGYTNARVRPEAASSSNGEASFYVESLSGQNNSLLKDYAGFRSSQAGAHVRMDTREVIVPTITLDTLRGTLNACDFIKIDVEGGELMVLEGATRVISEDQPAMMVEISENESAVRSLLRDHDYVLVEPDGSQPDQSGEFSGNYFAFHQTSHARQLRGLGIEGA